MYQLIVYAHPNPKSFCSAIKDVVSSIFKSLGYEVGLRDLYQIGFDPVLKATDFEAIQSGTIPSDIKTEQSYITKAEVVTFVYPIWWTGMPAIVKGYIDRVFCYGFAYSVDENHNIEKLLGGKKVLIINTMGTPNELYEQSGMIRAMKMTSETGIFEFCGMEVIGHKFFGAVPYVDDGARKAMLQQLEIFVRDSLKV